MRYFKLVVPMILLMAFLGATAFGAGAQKKKSGRTLAAKPAPMSVFEKKQFLSTLKEEGQRRPAQQADIDAARQDASERGMLPQSTSFVPPVSKPSGARTVEAIAGGTYRIPGNFPSLTAAAFDLTSMGVSGPVTILLGSASYAEGGFYMGRIPGASAVNTVTFQPDSNTAGVTITLTNNGTFGGGWVFAGTSYVTINGTKKNGPAGERDLTIQYDPLQALPAGASDAPIRIRDGASNITIENCVLTSQVTASAGRRAVSLTQSDPTAPNTYVAVNNCEITNAAGGVGSDALVEPDGNTGSFASHISVTNSNIHDVDNFGVYLFGANNSTVTGNTIVNVTNPSGFSALRAAGIFYVGFFSLIEDNKVDNIYGAHTRTFGIRVMGPNGLGNIFDAGDAFANAWAGRRTGNRIYQNVISRVDANNGGFIAEVGISTEGNRYDTLAHNTLYFTGTTVAGGGQIGLYTYGSALATARTISIDNIIDMDRDNSGALNVCVRALDIAGNDYRAPSDHNVYYHPFGDAMENHHSVYDIFSLYGQASDSHSLEGNPFLVSATDLHVDGTQPSSADNTGRPYPQIPNDFDGVARTAPEDIGAYNATSTGTQHDVGVISLDAPGGAGAPQGLPFSPISATVHNFTQNTEAGLTASIKIYDPTTALVYTGTSQSITLAWDSTASADFSAPWTPLMAGNYTFVIVFTVAGDVNTTNDTLTQSVNAAGVQAVPYTTSFETPADNNGWFGSFDWGLASVLAGDTKLGGAHTGDASWQTIPGPAGTIYNVQQRNDLYTPFFNLLTASDAYLSFYQSIQTEPEWDRSIFEYTIDTGKTWHKLGVLDDTAGINWYASTVYTNAAGANGTSCFDVSTATAKGFPTNSDGATGIWTSNGACLGADLPTGPNGWIYVQYHIPASILGHNYVRFRYSAFSDGATTFDGWAIDDFSISLTKPVLASAILSGTKYTDVDGSGTINLGDVTEAGTVLDIRYFGVHSAFDTTDGSGNYAYSMKLPGTYEVYSLRPASVVDFPAQGFAEVNYPGNGANITGVNLADYTGSISGKKFVDVNDNGLEDGGEPGSGGWTIEVHKDSANGPLAGGLQPTAVTAANGTYTIYVQPYSNYVVLEVPQPAARQTMPAGNAPYSGVSITGPSGGPGATVTGKDFGNWYYGAFRIQLEVDLNGNGVRDPSDRSAMPGLNYQAFEFLHNGTHVSYDTLGQASLTSSNHNLLDTAGYYSVRRISAIPTGWINTTPIDSFSFKFTTSGVIDTAAWLTFKLVVVNGTVFDDLNGNGTKDGGENGVAGKQVTISGAGTVTSDANGFYSDSAVGPGLHNVTLAAEAGITQTSGPYSFSAVSGNFPGSNQIGKNFGRFTNTTVSGTVYRDRNNDGARQAGEEGLGGWTVNLGRWGSQVSDASGAFTFTNVGPGLDTLTETLQAGYLQTQPAAAYNFSLTGGTPLAGQDFGNFKGADTVKYRTFTAAQLGANSEKKGGKAPKPGKPIDPVKNIINTGNLLSDIILQGGVIKVGLAGQMNAGGKEKSYIAPLKQADIFASFNAKGVNHTGAARGLDVDNKGNLMLKKAKSIPPSKKNDMLIADLLAFKVNLAASSTGKTPTGLGALVYYSPGQPFSGLRLDQIADSADNLMTNWEGIPFSVYVALDSVTAKVNAAFASGSVLDTATGWTSPKITWKAYTTVESIAFLHSSGAAAEIRFGTPPPVYIPKVYALLQNYPNPFNPTTAIQFDLPQSSIVTLKVYNVLGQEVATIVDHQTFDIGNQEVTFDASNFASGVYLYRIVAQSVNDDGVSTGNTFTQVKKMMLIK